MLRGLRGGQAWFIEGTEIIGGLMARERKRREKAGGLRRQGQSYMGSHLPCARRTISF